MATVTRLPLSGDENADDFVSTHPLALLIGLLLDQQVPTERAFAAPYQLSIRLDVDFDAAAIAWMPVKDLDACFRKPPALHRYPGMMARRVQVLCSHIVEHHHGDAANIWSDCDDGAALLDRIRVLPGFSEHDARVLLALLGKRLGVRPHGWEVAAGPYGLPGYRSVADVVDRQSLDRVRAFRREQRSFG